MSSYYKMSVKLEPLKFMYKDSALEMKSYNLYVNGALYTMCTEEVYAYEIFQVMKTTKGDVVTCWKGATCIFHATRMKKRYSIYRAGESVEWKQPLSL